MRVLRFAVRPTLVLKYFGQLCNVLACLTLVPLSVSLLFGDIHVSVRYLIVVVGVSLLGFSLTRLKAPERMQTNEAMVVTALIFVISPLVMAWPVMASGFGFLDALFETVSAVTTTGLSTAVNLSAKPATFLFSCSDECESELPTVTLVNNGTGKADVQIKTSGGNTENINNIAEGTSSEQRAFAPGLIEFTIAIQGVGDPIEYQLTIVNCNHYVLSINQDNSVAVQVVPR